MTNCGFVVKFEANLSVVLFSFGNFFFVRKKFIFQFYFLLFKAAAICVLNGSSEIQAGARREQTL